MGRLIVGVGERELHLLCYGTGSTATIPGISNVYTKHVHYFSWVKIELGLESVLHSAFMHQFLH